ncbi:MAG: CsgG/HfaB family protein, partial [Proteobacteria bacterium]|nr:CsgG/HfaB family protein [Pseudomonadota bacterium]
MILLIIFSGCGLFGRKKEFEFKDPLKLRVAVMPFDDSAGLGGQALGRRISEQLTKRLSQSEGLVVLPQERIEEYLRANEVPTPLTQNTATLVGRMLGLNAVVLGSTAELSQIQKRTGWLRWFSFLSSKHDFVA